MAGHGAGVQVVVADGGPEVCEGGGGACVDGEVEGEGVGRGDIGRREGEDGWERQEKESGRTHCALETVPGFAIEVDWCEKLGFGRCCTVYLSYVRKPMGWGKSSGIPSHTKVHSLLLSSAPYREAQTTGALLSPCLSSCMSDCRDANAMARLGGVGGGGGGRRLSAISFSLDPISMTHYRFECL